MSDPQPSPTPVPPNPDTAPVPTAAAGPVAPAAAASTPPPPPPTAPAAAGGPKPGLVLRAPPWLVWLALALAVAGLGWTYTVVQRLERSQEEMARRAADSLAAATAARELASAAEAKSTALAARLGVAELRLSEVALQRSQLEELMLAVSRTRDDSLVQDIEASVRFAMQQSQLSGSVQPLISALQGAEQRIERAAQPRLNPVQRAIASDIERLRAAQLVDGPALAQRLDVLVRQLDHWPLLNQPQWQAAVRPGLPVAQAEVAAALPERETEPVAAAAAAAPPQAAAPSVAPNAEPAAQAAPASAAQSVTEAAGAADPATAPSLWAQGWAWLGQWPQGASAWVWQQVRQGTSGLIRVSRIDAPEAALLAPEQAYFLRENIRLKLLSARFGLLARQFDSARADVLAVQALVQRYFDPAAPLTQEVLQTLAQLQTDLQQPALPRPDDTLAALLVAASGR